MPTTSNYISFAVVCLAVVPHVATMETGMSSRIAEEGLDVWEDEGLGRPMSPDQQGGFLTKERQTYIADTLHIPASLIATMQENASQVRTAHKLRRGTRSKEGSKELNKQPKQTSIETGAGDSQSSTEITKKEKKNGQETVTKVIINDEKKETGDEGSQESQGEVKGDVANATESTGTGSSTKSGTKEDEKKNENPGEAVKKVPVSKEVTIVKKNRKDKEKDAATSAKTGNEPNNTESQKEENAPFTKVSKKTKETSQDTRTEVEVEMASSIDIVSVYVIMVVPLVIGWMTSWHYGQPRALVQFLLPVTFVSMEVGFTLANQSITAILKSPFAISCIQAACTTSIAGIWAVTVDLPSLRSADLSGLYRWPLSSALFVLYQVVNHFASLYCSLTERTVFMNLAPLVALVFERLIMPEKLQPYTSFFSKLALGVMVVGSVLISAQAPDFTTGGVATALLLVLHAVPNRMLQRYLLRDCAGAPVSLLCAIDSGLLFLTSIILLFADFRVSDFSRPWLKEPAVLVILILSIVGWGSAHALALLVLREGSAAGTLVLQQIGGLVCIFMGVSFFGDKVFASPIAVAGLLIATGSGIWYSIDVTWGKLSKSNDETLVEPCHPQTLEPCDPQTREPCVPQTRQMKAAAA